MDTAQAGERAPRKVIAVVTDALAPFHRNVLDCIWPHFSAAGFGMLAIAGRDIRTDRLLEASDGRHGLYRGAFGTQLDVQGAVIVCGATHPSMSLEAIQEYVEALANGPVVSLGIALPGTPSVEVGWPKGIAALMDHVLTVPDRRSFGFVQGFPNDPHSEMREAGFRKAMRQAGIAVDERLIVRGNFSVADARLAVSDLLGSGFDLDCLIAANDDMAVGAMAAITAHGLSVPDDVIVAGFDDALSSITSAPTLTTVRLDNLGLAATTAELVLGAIETGVALPADLVVGVESDLVIRESTRSGRGVSATTSLEQRLVARWGHGRAPAHIDIDDLAVAAVASLRSGGTAFFEQFEAMCTQAAVSTNRVEVMWLRHVWRELQAVVSGGDHNADARRTMLDQLIVLDGLLHNIEARHSTERVAHQQLQERLVMRLVSCSDTVSLWETLRSGLHSIGMINAWVVTNGGSMVNDQAGPSMELIFSLDSENLADVRSFDARRILPSGLGELLERDMHVLVPLRAGDTDIGYMIVEPQGEVLLELESIASGVAQVLRHVGQVADLEGQTAQLHTANEALDRLARQDSLTGLANRAHFVARLEQHVADIGQDEALAMVFLDLDGFKQINDNLGHGAGDQLLRIIADRLGDVIGEQDTVARLGGDEFTIIVHDAHDHDRVFEVARRTLDVAARSAMVDGQQVRVTASVGIATFPFDGFTAESLMRNADTAMYAAKEAGRNRFKVFTTSQDEMNRHVPHGAERRF